MEKLQANVQLLLNLFKLRKFNDAESLNKDLLKKYPKSGYLYNMLGLILASQKKNDDAIKTFKKGIEVEPDFAHLYDNLATAYKAKSQFKLSEEFYKKSISINKKIPEPHNNLGNLYIVLNNYKKAIASYKNAIKLNKKFFTSYYNLGILYKNAGNFKDSIKCLENALKINPYLFSAHRSLSEMTKYTKNIKHYKFLNKIYEEKKIGKEKKTELIFALGKANNDLKKFDDAFSYYKEANDLRRKEVIFSLEKERKIFSQIKKTFNKNLFDKFETAGLSESSAIFIVGMPRSGTTLIEQILSSHHEVFGGDELKFLIDLADEFIFEKNDKSIIKQLNNFNKNYFNKIGKKYISKIKNLSNFKDRITDKLPVNFKWVGLIKLILPNSKIIHCTRNSRDVCLSIYKNYFINPQLNFSYSLEEIVDYYNLYDDLMKHWNKILPDFIINVKYENIVSDPSDQIKILLKKCNLNWDSNCLKFYNNKRLIKTSSDTQARKKIYKTSLNSWINYKKNLDIFFKNLP